MKDTRLITGNESMRFGMRWSMWDWARAGLVSAAVLSCSPSQDAGGEQGGGAAAGTEAGGAGANSMGGLGSSGGGGAGGATSCEGWDGERVVLQLPAASRLNALAVAADGAEAMVFYALASQNFGDAPTRLMLARLDGAGVLLDEPTLIAELTPEESAVWPELSIASEEGAALLCWSTAAHVACKGLTGSSEELVDVLAVEGRSAAVARGGLGWLVAYSNASQWDEPGDFVLQRFTDEFDAASEPRAIRFSDAVTTLDVTPVLAATESEFVLLAPDSTKDEHVQLYRLGTELENASPVVDLGVPFWFRGAAAANARGTLVSLAKPYATSLFWIDANGGVELHEVSGGFKAGMVAGVFVGESAALAAWFMPDAGTPRVQAFPLAGELGGTTEALDATLNLVSVSDRLLALYIAGPSGPASEVNGGGGGFGIAARCVPRPAR